MLSRSFIECQIDIDKFKKVRRLNKGGYGIVYLVQQVETGKIYASKVIDCNDNIDLCKKIIDREIEIMMYAHHPTIINFIGYSLKDFQNENNVVIFMELAENGSLLDVIQSIQKRDIPKDYSNTIRQIILIGISRGMKYLHDRNIMHRDLKPGNILLDKEFHPHISDFGMSKFYEYGHSDSQSQNGGTLQYMAPEVIDGEPYDTKADVYSFGILMYEVVSDQKPYPEFANGSLNSYNFTKKVINENYRPSFNFPIKKSIQNLIEKCWSKSKNDRPTFKEIFNKLASGKSEIENEDYFLDGVDEEKILKYVYDITEITDPIEKLNSQIDMLEKETEKLKIDNKKLNDNNKKLYSVNNTLISKNDQLSTENKKLLADKNELLANNKQLLLKNEKLTTENEHLSINNNCLLSDEKKLKSENEKLTVENSRLMVNNQHLTNDNKQLLEIKKQVEEDKKQLLSHNDLFTKNNEKLNLENKQLVLSNNDLTQKNQSLLIQNEKISADNKQLSIDNKKLSADNKQLATFNKLAENKKEQLSNSIILLNNQIKILASENDDLSSDIQSIISEYEVQILSTNNVKFIKEMKDISINQFNSLPLILQKLTFSEIISHLSNGEINQFLIKVNNLMLFLLRFDQFKVLNCIEIISENNDQLLSEIKDDYSIQLLPNVTDILYSINQLTSNDFISILKKIDNFSIVLKYPIDSFQKIFEIITGLKTYQFNENHVQIEIFVSGVSEFNYSFECDKNVDCVLFDSFVESISQNAFNECSSLTRVEFDKPSLLYSIGDYSFRKCLNLEEFEIPSSVSSLGALCFGKCSSLTRITIPSSVTKIKKSCFYQCTSMQEVEFEDNSQLTFIGVSCFQKCSSLKEINIPPLVTEIKESTFKECTSLVKVTIPLNITKIGTFSFYSCSSLKEINIPSSVVEIESHSFDYCSSLTKMNIPSSVKIIGHSAFKGCSSMKDLVIPSSVTKIGECAFLECSSLTQIIIPSSITTIEGSTFCRCTSLKEVEIPFSVKFIESYAFNGCYSLHKLVVPCTATIKNNAFAKETTIKIKYTFGRRLLNVIYKVVLLFYGFLMLCIILNMFIPNKKN